MSTSAGVASVIEGIMPMMVLLMMMVMMGPMMRGMSATQASKEDLRRKKALSERAPSRAHM